MREISCEHKDLVIYEVVPKKSEYGMWVAWLLSRNMNKLAESVENKGVKYKHG